MSGTALRLKVELSRLAEKHGVVAAPQVLPLLDPIHGPVAATGQATTISRDLTRMQFAPWCFGMSIDATKVPLLLRHDPAKIVGRVVSLSYDRQGALQAHVVITEEAGIRMPSYSVGCDVVRYRLTGETTSDYGAVIEEAVIRELSLTDRPAQPGARIQHRWPCAASEFYTLAQKRVAIIAKMAAILQATAAGVSQ
jgi:phage head maturation protease